MKTLVAWHKLIHNPRRTAAVVAGTWFSILLMFLQLGLYEACKLNATMIYDMFDFDAVLVSPYYLYLDLPGSVAMHRIHQARAFDGVEAVIPVYLGKAGLRNIEKDQSHRIFGIGVHCSDRPFVAEGINDDLRRVSKLDTVLMDLRSSSKYGPRSPGVTTELGGRQIRIVGEYSHGAGFISGGTLVASHQTFCRVVEGASPEYPSLGLIRFAPGHSPESAMEGISARLPEDVRVWSRSFLEEKERHFAIHVKPLGIMFTSGTVIAFLVGAVIIFQILSTEVIHHRRELATMKAMGYPSSALKRIVLEEGFLLVSFGFVPALLLSWYLYGLLRTSVKIPIHMTPGRIVLVLALSLIMSGISGLLAVREVSRADPAELF